MSRRYDLMDQLASSMGNMANRLGKNITFEIYPNEYNMYTFSGSPNLRRGYYQSSSHSPPGLVGLIQIKFQGDPKSISGLVELALKAFPECELEDYNFTPTMGSGRR